MSLIQIEVPASIKEIPHSSDASRLIDNANDRLDAFMLADREVIENFVTCDFHLVDQAMQWIQDSHLAAGNRFCELGSGFGVAAMLAAVRGMESIGIEIEQVLVDQANDLASDLGIAADFYCGSFIPRDVPGLLDLATEVKNVDTQEGDVWDEVGLEMQDFDLFFAFPWPGEYEFFEAVFDACAPDGAILLTYRGRDGVNLVRKN